MKYVFLFPGQGAQKKGMIFDICQKYPEAMETVKLAEKISGEPVSKYLWETEDAELARSDRSQLAINTASLAIINVLKAHNINADICAGFSLGEFAALYAAGILSLEDTIALVCKRGNIMQKACDELSLASEGSQPGMAAVIGLTPKQVTEAIKDLSYKGIAFTANLNSSKQTVISGTAEGLMYAEKLCTEAGCRRFIKLKVAGPFHSPLMAKAGEEFSKVLGEVKFNVPEKIVLSNVTGKKQPVGTEENGYQPVGTEQNGCQPLVTEQIGELKKNSVLHFTHPVRWIEEEAEIAKLIGAEKTDCKENWKILEIGPGTVLSGLWRDSGYSENISCESVNSLEAVENLIK